eukprot:m.79850 g.79850  ORF g.79850 m.79850 type:complete len:74 (+) comp12729_c0_seq4:1686-1907(+)
MHHACIVNMEEGKPMHAVQHLDLVVDVCGELVHVHPIEANEDKVQDHTQLHYGVNGGLQYRVTSRTSHSRKWQ